MTSNCIDFKFNVDAKIISIEEYADAFYDINNELCEIIKDTKPHLIMKKDNEDGSFDLFIDNAFSIMKITVKAEVRN